MLLSLMPEATIPIKNILQRTEIPSIANLDELLAHIEKRKTYFLATLAANKSNSDTVNGWQKIRKDEEGLIKKERLTSPSTEGIFTAEMLCTNTCVVLAEALKKLITANNLKITIEMVTFKTGTAAENETQLPVKRAVLHNILKLTEEKSKRSVFLDATYAQINHRFAGQITQFDQSQFNTLYQLDRTQPVKFHDIDNFPFKNLVTNIELKKPEQMEKLIATLL
jgi:hypothetical protein